MEQQAFVSEHRTDPRSFIFLKMIFVVPVTGDARSGIRIPFTRFDPLIGESLVPSPVGEIPKEDTGETMPIPAFPYIYFSLFQ